MQILATISKVNKIYRNKNIQLREKPSGFSLSFLLSLFFFVFSTNLSAQYNHHRIYENLLNGRFKERLTNTEILQPEYLADNTSAASIMAITFEAFFAGTPDKFENAIELTDQFLDQSSDLPYNLAIGHTSEAILKSINGAYFGALVSFYNAHRSIENYAEKTNCIEPVIYELNTLYNITFSKIPKGYMRLLNVAGVKPIHIDSGKLCNQENQQLISSTFTTIFNLFSPTDKFVPERNSSEMSKLIAGIHYLGRQQPDSALLYLDKMDTIRSNLIVLNYYKGIAYLNLGIYVKAERYFDKYLFLQQKGRYIKATLLRKKWIAIITNKPFKHFTKDILERGTELTFLDKQAQKEAHKSYHTDLLRARLLFDGGKFAESNKTLDEIDKALLNESDYTNYIYRKARNLHGLKEYNLAIKQYNRILQRPNNGDYFHKKAMLEIGKIHIEKSDNELAIKYLLKIEDIYSDTFNESFEREAEMLIEQLKTEQKE